MPNGELRPDRKMVRVSAMPSPSESRSSVIRLALGTAPPAFVWYRLKNHPLSPFSSSGLGGALVSATSTSPFGSTYNQRGWSSPCANACTVVPSADAGVAPAGQLLAFTTLTVGSNECL